MTGAMSLVEIMHGKLSIKYSGNFEINVNIRLSEAYLGPYHTFRNSHRRCSVRKDVLRNIAKFTGKHQCQTAV